MKITLNEQGITLAEALSKRTDFSNPCGGKGRCGACKVRASGALSEPDERERAVLGESCPEWRLACRAVCLGEVTAELPEGKLSVLADTGERYQPKLPLSKGKYGIAVDVGTTTIAAVLVDCESGSVCKTVTCKNPQSARGADVMTRIDYAVNGGSGELRHLLSDSICALIKQLTAEPVDTAVITGNTAMLCFLAGADTASMAGAPFGLPCGFGDFFDGSMLGDCKVKRLYLTPCISSFVGGDMTSAMVACNMESEDDALLVDIGTNGEMALMRGGVLTAASTPAGPAFEGAEIECGMPAVTGAIHKVTAKDGEISVHTIGGAPAVGICGSGLVSAVAAMLDSGIIDGSGYMDSPVTLSNGVREEQATPLRSVRLTPADIRALQTAKSAIRSGIDILCGERAPAKLYIAGGFGSCLDVDACIRIGLLPAWAKGRTAAVGNAALRGAVMILLDETKKRLAESFAGTAAVCELDLDPRFAEAFAFNMLFEEKETYK